MLTFPVTLWGPSLVSVSLFASTSSSTSSVTVPANVIAGDMIYWYQVSATALGNPTAVTLSGFTVASNLYDGTSIREMLQYKLALGTEGGTGLTGMNGVSSNTGLMAVLRTNVPVLTAGAAQSVGAEITTANPSAQTVTSSGSTPPAMVIGAYFGSAAVTSRVFTIDGIDAKDGEVDATIAARNIWLAWKLMNTPANVVVDMNDVGTNALASFYHNLTG